MDCLAEGFSGCPVCYAKKQPAHDFHGVGHSF